MNIKEYEQHLNLYAEFAKTVKNILEIAIKNHNNGKNIKLNLHQIQSRAKSLVSLENKIKKKQADKESINIKQLEQEITDLAGCRVIFYYNDDVTNFNHSFIIDNNFEIDWGKMKIHYPIKNNDSYYIARHYLVRLKKSRIKLPEYRDFDGLWCEIQIHTILNHAWAETSHNIIYKKPSTEVLGKALLTSIEERLNKLMNEHLLPAGYEFQKIQSDYQKLLKGKNILESELQKIYSEKIDNNERLNILDTYYNYTLRLFDNYEKQLPDIIKLVKTAYSTSKKIQILPIKTPFGSFAGRSSSDILDICLRILNYVRYTDIASIFDSLLELFSQSQQTKEQEKILENIENLSHFNVKILEKIGLYTQQTMLYKIDNWNTEMLLLYRAIAVKVCEAVLCTQLEDWSFTYEQYTRQSYSLNFSQQLSELRQKAIQILIKLYRRNISKDDRGKIIVALEQGTKQPIKCNYSDDLFAMILCDNKIILDFYINTASSMPNNEYELTRMEFNLRITYLRAKNYNSSNSQISKLNEILLAGIQQFRDKLKENEEFFIYKINCYGLTPAVFSFAFQASLVSLTREALHLRADAHSFMRV